MSRESDIMDKILAIAGSKVSGSTTARSYTAHSDIEAYSLPYIQAFNPVTETDRLDWRQNNSQLTFSVEIIAASGSGQSDTVRGWLDAINLAIKADTSLDGLVWDSFISTRGVDERSVRERVMAGMIFSIRSWDEYSITDSEVTLVDFSDPTVWTTTTNNSLSVAQLSPNSIAITMDSGNTACDVSGGTSTSNPDATWDLSGTPTTLYAHVFISDDLYAAMAASGTVYTITYGSTSGSDWVNFTGEKSAVSKGWNRLATDLSSPSNTGGGTFPTAAVPEISVSFTASPSSSITNAATVYRIYRESSP